MCQLFTLSSTRNIGKLKTCQGNNFTFSSALGGVSRVSSSWVWDFRVKFQFGPSDKGFYISFDSSEKPQKNPRCSQVSVRPLKVRRRRVGIPGKFGVLKVHIAEVAEWGNGIGWHQEWGTRGLLPDVFKDPRDLKWIGAEGNDPHWFPTLAAAGQWIGFIDFSNPFCPAWRLLRIEIHRNSLHQDLLDPFFAVFALKFAVMTAGVIAP